MYGGTISIFGLFNMNISNNVNGICMKKIVELINICIEGCEMYF